MGYSSVGSGFQNSVQAVFNPHISRFEEKGAGRTFYSQEVDITNKSYLGYCFNHESTAVANSVLSIYFGGTLLFSNTENNKSDDVWGLIDISAYNGAQTIIITITNGATDAIIKNLNLWLVD
jgi:hypothetical protein